MGYSIDCEALQVALKSPPNGYSERKWRRHLKRKLRKEQRGKKKEELKNDIKGKQQENIYNQTVVVVDLNRNGEVDFLYFEEVVSFLISQHRNNAFGNLEVVILIESPGGSVSDFGLGASQIRRL